MKFNVNTLKLVAILLTFQIMVAVCLVKFGITLVSLSLLALPIVAAAVFSLYTENKFKRITIKHIDTAAAATQELNRVRQSANKDPLTGLNSKSYLKERLDEILEVAVQRQRSCAILYLDLDFFKEINEALGHTLGNQLLTKVAYRLKSLVKKGDVLAYHGGDEFVVVLPTVHDMMAAELVARRIISAMTQNFEIHDHKLSVSTSIGIAMGPVDSDNGEGLIRKAESALKYSKKKARKGYSFYSKELNDNAAARLKIDQQLRGALERGEFYIAYQPIVSDKGKKLKGFEALLRWQNAELGAVSPEQFIPIAEQIGLITDIGNWVLRESVQQLKAWQSQYSKPITMSVNVSPRQFQDESILPAVKTVLKQTGIKPQLLQLEVTEGLFLNASERTLNSIDLLKQLGVRLALDDFGTGYSSLSYLNDIPFDVLKVDKSFIDGICIHDRDRKMVRAIIYIAHSLNMEVVVEGVETPQQVHSLREMNADSLQGYYYSKPLKSKEAESRFLQNDNTLELNESIWDELSK